MEAQDLKAARAQSELLVNLGSLDPKVHQELMETQESLEARVMLDETDWPVLPETLDPEATQAHLGREVSQACLDKMAKEDQLEPPDQQALKDPREKGEVQGLVAHLAALVHLVLLARMERKAPQEKEELLVLLEVLVHQALQETLDHEDRPVKLEVMAVLEK